MVAEILDIGKLMARGQVAETLLKELRDKVSRLRQQVAGTEVERLTRENEQLSLQCEAWRQRLIKAEVANGKKQYPIPVRFTGASAADGSAPATPAPSGAAPAAAPVPAAAPGGDAKGKPKKANKPAKDGAAANAKPEKANKENQANAGGTVGADGDAVCVSQLDLRVGLITQVDKHPDADALYLEQIDVGEDKPRTVVSGLVKFVSLEEMRNRLVVVMCNLKPAKMRGVVSEGMVMCASTPEKVEPVRPPKGAAPGDRVTWTGRPAEGYPAPETALNPKKKIWERIAPELKIDGQGQTVWNGKALEVRGKGPVTADSLKNVNVK